jgi:16S rRNA processing protein RimM
VAAADRVVVGRVGRPHGLDGAFVVENASDDGRWFVVGARLIAAGADAEVVLARRGGGGRRVIRLDHEVARGTPLEVAKTALPATEADEYYVFELVGLDVVEDGGRELGRVASVEPGVANDVLALEGGLLLPLVGECVRDIDLEARRILVAPGFSDPV